VLVNFGYNPNFGARPVKRVIKHKVESELPDKIECLAEARAHRLGQKRDVFVLHLEMVQTIEE
jgi:ATP-dependent Clp protease ATP-binding subunit ClpA